MTLEYKLDNIMVKVAGKQRGIVTMNYEFNIGHTHTLVFYDCVSDQ